MANLIASFNFTPVPP